jgi:hypothetical protein
MTTSNSNDARAERVKVTTHNLIVYLVDGRKLEVPLAWFPRLCKATSAQRKQYRLIGQGIGIHWPKIDEDISVEGLLNMSAYSLSFQNSVTQTKSAA